jgi:peptide/nickel transport system substrate-binding protein
MPIFLRRTQVLIVLLAVLLAGGYFFYNSRTGPNRTGSSSIELAGTGSASDTVRRGGQLIATLRTEPRSFNRFFAPDPATKLVTTLTQAALVRVNQVTQELEPWLAERWETAAVAGPVATAGVSSGAASGASPTATTGERYLVHLRKGLTFSDGAPFTSADVTFTFQVLYDPKVGSPLAEAYKIDGKPLDVTATDEHTLNIVFPAPYGPGLRWLESLPILPRHKLEAAWKEGKFRDAWGVATPPAEIVGLGPFVLKSYAPGQRLELERNAKYWRKDSNGEALPYLDRLTIEITPTQAAEMLKFEAGQADLLSSELRPEDIPAARKLVEAKKVRLHDLGVGLDSDFLWFNLTPKGPTTTAIEGVPARPWLGRREFRHAILHAIDRQQFVDTVLLGAGAPVDGPITPGNKEWVATGLPTYPYDPAKAGALLDELGLKDVNKDGIRDIDSKGTPVRFNLFTQKGHATRERAAAVIKEDLRKIGIQVDVTPLDLPALRERIGTGVYDAIYFGILASDRDPAVNLDFWLSRGAFHVWNPGQTTPATPWEKEIDALMLKSTATTDQAERKRLFDQVQKLLATEQPVMHFAAANTVVATSTRVLNAQPTLLRPQVLWAPDTVAVRH